VLLGFEITAIANRPSTWPVKMNQWVFALIVAKIAFLSLILEMSQERIYPHIGSKGMVWRF